MKSDDDELFFVRVQYSNFTESNINIAHSLFFFPSYTATIPLDQPVALALFVLQIHFINLSSKYS